MRKRLGFVVLGASLAAASFACVDDYTSTPDAPAQGSLGGDCFANSTCFVGLTCGLVGGKAQCVGPDGGTGTSSGTSGSTSGASSGSTSGPLRDADVREDSSNSGPTTCSFTPTAFPCGGDNPPTACYGATQSCTVTGCGGASDIRWSCNSPKDCGGTVACCLGKASGTATPAADCSTGTLQITEGTETGSVCASEKVCPANETQLCSTQADCPAGQACKAVKITGAGASFNGQTLGVCAP